jgi:serine/threonine protein kinase
MKNRFERDFLKEYFELHRRESVAMERLNSSPYIIDIYSYCGNSMVNEFADFIQGYQNFRAFAKQLSGNNEDKVLNLKLQIATMIALGVQHIHEIDESMNTTLVHYDLNPMNVVITAGGIPKINDFNLAEFIQWKPDTNERCGFRGRFKEPWWRSPEEMLWNQNKTSDVPLLNGKHCHTYKKS